MTDDYKIRPAYLQKKMLKNTALLRKAGKPVLETYVTSTVNIINMSPKAYLRFGPYWFAVKRVLKDCGHDYGLYELSWMADEYAIRLSTGETDRASTLLAAWEFADGMDTAFIADSEYEIDGRMWSVEDDDMLSPSP